MLLIIPNQISNINEGYIQIEGVILVKNVILKK